MTHPVPSTIRICHRIFGIVLAIFASTCLLLSSHASFAQSYTDQQVKAELIVRLLEHMTWPNENDITAYQIGVLGHNKDLGMALVDAAKSRRIKGREIKISLLPEGLADKTFNVLVIANDALPDLPRLARSVRGEHVLLVTDGSLETTNTMINLQQSDNSTISFSVHKGNLLLEGLQVNEDILLLGGTELDVAQLYRELEDHMADLTAEYIELQQTVDAAGKKLLTAQGDLDQATNQLSAGESKLTEQNAIIDARQEELLNLETEQQANRGSIAAGQVLLNNQRRVLSQRLAEVEQLRSDIEANQALLEKQKGEIARQKRDLAGMQGDLQLQRDLVRQKEVWLYSSLMALLVISILSVRIAFINRAKKRIHLAMMDLNRDLEEKVRQRTKDMEVARDEAIEMLEKHTLIENKLRQAQKLHAVGQLTGGVAHDFNNLLGVIMGNMSLLEMDLDSGQKIGREEVQPLIESINRASTRGADLTHRLLAFSREQALKPAPLKVNKVVVGMENLLVRTLSEDIRIVQHLGATSWLAMADIAELENVVLNLAINSQDAMPSGGCLTIETSQVTLDEDFVASQVDVSPGDYLMLAVSDTGTGMDDETLQKVFDPFFTTKGVGKGTGLGLAMVYGFAKQSGGHVTIYSELGEGTTVKLYLPRTTEPEQGQIQGPAPVPQSKGNETVLVVEDEIDVRNVVVQILTRQGYRVLAADSGAAAQEHLESDEIIDILLTDVILPGGVSGPEISVAARATRPGLKVLFMSGYTQKAMNHRDQFDGIVDLINKPFTNSELGIRVRQALDSES